LKNRPKSLPSYDKDVDGATVGKWYDKWFEGFEKELCINLDNLNTCIDNKTPVPITVFASLLEEILGE